MRANRTMATPSQPIVPKKRCAIYTRKSTDEGLDQEYNSLEAQRDAGLAFVASQRHEGWVAVGDGYDDGGYSGGNLDRPGLKRLMADIEAGSWGDIAGSNGNFGLEDGDYIGLPTDADSWNFESFTTDEYEEVKGKIKSGEITVDNSSDDATKPTDSEFTTVNYIQ